MAERDHENYLDKKLFSFLIVLFILSEMAFFALPVIPSSLYELCTYSRKGLSCVLIVGMLLVCQWSEIKRGKIKVSSKGLISATVSILVFILLIFVLSLFMYNQSLLSLFKAYFYYFELLAVIPLSYYFIRFSGFKFFCKVFMLAGTLLAAYMLLQAALYNSSGVVIMSTHAIDFAWKFGSVRLMDQSTVNVLTVLFCFGYCLDASVSKASRITYFLLGILSIVCIFAVVQTRAMQLALVASLGVLFFLRSKDARVRLAIVCFFLVVICLSLGSIGDFVDSFNETPQGTAVRLYGWSYYASSIFSNVLWGLGLISPDSAVYSAIALGNGHFYPSDLGVMKFFGTIGVFGIFFYVFVLVQATRITYDLYKKNGKYFSICLLMLVYLITSSVSLGFCDNVRILYLPLMMAIMIYASYQSKKQVECEVAR